MKELLSPKQVARAIGVSESSLKRWCDQGLIQTVRTAGGHRKLPMGDVIRFLRERKHVLLCPEVLGMPVRSPQSEIGLQKGCSAFTEALLDGNEALALRIIFDLYLAKHAVSVICDEVIIGAFHGIGDRLARQMIDVYQERRACEFTQRILYELRRAQAEPDPAWKAIGGSLSGDPSTIPTAMAELVLRNAGWDATSIGTLIPVESLVQAIRKTKPRLVWVCLSNISDPEKFVIEYKRISDAAQEEGTAIAVGGCALTAELRKQITFCCYCDKLQHLESFVKTVRQLGSALLSE